MIKQVSRKVEQVKIAGQNGWPITNVDFRRMPSRIIALRDHLMNITYDLDVREQVYTWTCFEADLEVQGWTLAQFGWMGAGTLPLTSPTVENSRPG